MKIHIPATEKKEGYLSSSRCVSTIVVKELWEKMNNEATKRNMSMSSFLRELIKKTIDSIE